MTIFKAITQWKRHIRCSIKRKKNLFDILSVHITIKCNCCAVFCQYEALWHGHCFLLRFTNIICLNSRGFIKFVNNNCLYLNGIYFSITNFQLTFSLLGTTIRDVFYAPPANLFYIILRCMHILLYDIGANTGDGFLAHPVLTIN